MEALDHQRKNLVLNVLKQTQNVTLQKSLHCIADNSYLFVNRKQFFKFKADNKNVIFRTQFCLGGISNGFIATEFRVVNENAYDFSVNAIWFFNYNSIGKSAILNIHKYLMTKNNIKWCSACLLYF